MKNLLLSFSLALSIFLGSVFNVSAQSNIPDITAPHAVAIEASTGAILFEKNAHEKMYPASTTKVWTAYLVAKNVKDLKEVVTVTKDLSDIEPSSMFLKVGESFTVEQLLQVLMLKSANDVAVVLAEHVSGSVEEFSKLMNAEAKKIGCLNTNFVNPNGLPDDNHYSTAYDMALIGKESLKNKFIAETAKLTEISIPATEFTEERHYINSNKFLTGGKNMIYNGQEIDIKYDIVDGLKTGYTEKAKRCLLSTAKKRNTRVITAVFGADGDNIYSDSRAIIDYSLDNFSTEILLSPGTISIDKPIPLSKEKSIKGYIKEDFTLVKKLSLDNAESNIASTAPVDNTNSASTNTSSTQPTQTNIEASEATPKGVVPNNIEYSYDIELTDELKAPIKKDTKIGTVNIYDQNKRKIDEISIYSSDSISMAITISTSVIIPVFMSMFILIIFKKISDDRMKKKLIYNRIGYASRRR